MAGNQGVPEPVSVPRYSDHIDFPALFAEYPTAPDYFSTTYRLSADALRELQNDRFLKQMIRAWQIPFYQRHWGAAGMEPGDVRSLDDLAAIPAFSVRDMRDAIARHPPFGDLVALDTTQPMPLLLQTSGGTTGLPRPMLYSPRDREIMSIITGRRLHMQGVRPFDAVQVAVAQGLTNGGAMAREGLWKYSGAIGVMSGSGVQTPDRRQIEIMQAWKTKALIGFPAYLRRLALLMREEMKLDPAALGIRSIIAHLGVESREGLEALWGAKAYDTYGTNECGSLASECWEQAGMHVFGDAFVLEIVDPETNRAKAPGERGVIYQTTLFKHLAPLVRFNSNDVSAHIAGICSCGSCHPRIDRISGRTDNMLVLRGKSLFPEAVGEVVAALPEASGEYVCVVEGRRGAEEMTVLAETREGRARPDLDATFSANISAALGFAVIGKTAARGALDELTGIAGSGKIKRLIDRRIG